MISNAKPVEDVAVIVTRLRRFRTPLVVLLSVLCVRVVQVGLANQAAPSAQLASGALPAQESPQDARVPVAPVATPTPAQTAVEQPASAVVVEAAPVLPAVTDILPPAVTPDAQPSISGGSLRALTHAVVAVWKSRRETLPMRLLDAPDAWKQVALTLARRGVPVESAADAGSPHTSERMATQANSHPTGQPVTPATAEIPRVVITNPAGSGGDVHYLLGRDTYSLRPGESQELPASQEWRISFHRGGNFGNAVYALTKGGYEFQVTARGWDLLHRESLR